MITRDVSRSLTQLVDRANNRTGDEDCWQRVRQLEAQVSQLQALLTQYQREAAQAAEKTLYGRPVLTIEEAARKAGVKYHTARRYVVEGFWSAEQDESRTWFVYADRPLVKKPRKSRNK